MADYLKGELQDYEGNVLYPHTEANVVFCSDGKSVQDKLANYEGFLVGVTGKTDSLEVDDTNILATSKATKKLNDSLIANDGLKFQFSTDGEGNYGYLGADGSLIPFKSDLTKLKWTVEKYTGSGISQTFAAPYDCLCIASAGIGKWDDIGSSVSVVFTTTGTTIYYLGNASASYEGVGGCREGSLGIYKLSKGQVVTMNCATGGSFPAGGAGFFCYTPL